MQYAGSTEILRKCKLPEIQVSSSELRYYRSDLIVMLYMSYELAHVIFRLAPMIPCFSDISYHDKLQAFQAIFPKVYHAK